MGSRDHRPRRPMFGADLRLGVVLAVALAVKFAPPMLSAKIDKPTPQPTQVASLDNRPPTDALTNTLPTSVQAPAADDPPVLAAPVFAFDEKNPTAAKPLPPELPKADPLDPPKPPTLAAASKKSDADAPAPAKPIKLRPPESIRNNPPILLADAPKKASSAKEEGKESSPRPAAKKGPLHPYFQRYLDQKEYYVRPGDTLESIAHRLYQDEAKATDLLAANKDSLPTAAALKAGMTIKLP
jgi:nucleoid-associated protein YgaU